MVARLLQVGLLLLLYSPWASAQSPSTQDVPAGNAEVKLEKCELGHATPVHRLGRVYLAGQPTEADLPKLKVDGFRTIINLRLPDELPWDEASAVERAGMKYVHVPFQGEQQLTFPVFDKVLSALSDPKSGRVLLHCGSANRVGAVWYAHRVLHDKLDPVAAELEAKQVGLRDMAYLKKAQEYVGANQVE